MTATYIRVLKHIVYTPARTWSLDPERSLRFFAEAGADLECHFFDKKTEPECSFEISEFFQ